MPYKLGAKSVRELVGVHPRLVEVVKRAIEISAQDFSVHDGLRTPAEQAVYVQRGVSTTLDSKHLRQADGFGHAVDLVPYINGKLRWEWAPIYHIAAAVHQAAGELGVALRWGGVWDQRLGALSGDAAGLEDAVADYVQRERARKIAAGRKPKVFIDGPHFELAS